MRMSKQTNGEIQMNYLTYEEICKRASEANNGPYEFVARANGKYVLRCKTHGDFQLPPGSFYNGSGCWNCELEKRRIRFNAKIEAYRSEFVGKCLAIHGDRYDYSKVVYTGALHKVTIVCREHGDFEQFAANHVRGTGCPTCAINSRKLQAEFRRDDEAYQARRALALSSDPVYYVYMYRDPRPENFGTPVYVGMGKGDRMFHHLTNSHSRAVRAFVAKMAALNLPLAPELVKTGLLQAEAFDLERETIAKYRRRKDGGTLLNLTLGGEGPTCFNHTEESKRKIGEASRRIMSDPEYKAAWMEKHKAGCQSEEAALKKSKATTAGWQNEETRRKRSEGIKASRSTEESRAKTRAQQAEQWDDEAKKKASDFAKERLQDPLIKARSSVANAYNWCKRQGRPFSDVTFPPL